MPSGEVNVHIEQDGSLQAKTSFLLLLNVNALELKLSEKKKLCIM